MIELKSSDTGRYYIETNDFENFKKLERYINFINGNFKWGPDFVKTPLTADNASDWQYEKRYLVAVLDSELPTIKEAIKILNDTTI